MRLLQGIGSVGISERCPALCPLDLTCKTLHSCPVHKMCYNHSGSLALKRNGCRRSRLLVHAVNSADGQLKSEAERFVEGIDLDAEADTTGIQDPSLPIDDAVTTLRQRCAELETQVTNRQAVGASETYTQESPLPRPTRRAQQCSAVFCNVLATQN